MTDISFSEFMAARWAPLYRTAYLLVGRREEAEDLLQSALARTCVRWDRIRDKAAADAYVRKAMLNQMSRQWRTRRRELPTEVLPDRPDVLVLPPGAFYPWHYLEKSKASKGRPPFCFVAHHWRGSWLSDEHRRSIEKRQRP